MPRYIVLIGDLIASKELGNKEREQYQAVLKDETDRISQRSEQMLSPLTITLGDEFQAVYKDVAALLSDSWSILAALHPVGVRFSIGIGEIYTPINTDQALGMDGPAFHAARSGMDGLKESGRLYSLKIGSNEDQNAPLNSVISLINCSLSFLSNEMKQWKKTRFEILAMLHDGKPVKEIAEVIGVSESAVYKNRDEGDLGLVMTVPETVGQILKHNL